MRDWEKTFNDLSDTDKEKIAVLRVMECANGVIQHAYRSNQEWALPIEDTRRAMKFSMSCMKNMTIPLNNGKEITFEPETEELLREVRDLYVSGFKNGNDEDYEKFMLVSKACVRALGKTRIITAKVFLLNHVDDIPEEALEWGVGYLMQFFA